MALKAVVYRGGRRRAGKGFSKEELRAIGLSLREALRLKVPVDLRRRTKHEENVKTLKRFLSSLSSQRKLKKEGAQRLE
ncbi:MAG: ribosomal protein L13e [Candidatus Bathyarchaeia archaeon]|nr:ribosomal protein L13e [Candidatus Bathyarchaeota archaeon]